MVQLLSVAKAIVQYWVWALKIIMADKPDQEKGDQKW